MQCLSILIGIISIQCMSAFTFAFAFTRNHHNKGHNNVINRLTLSAASPTDQDQSQKTDELIGAEEKASLMSNPMFLEPVSTPSSSISSSTTKQRSSEELILIAKRFLAGSNGLGGDPNLLAENFQFEGPVVGPLTKDAFVKAIGSVDFQTAFPNWKPEFYGFYVDPHPSEQANRVWYTARGRGVNEGPLPPFAPIPTKKEVINPPQVCSLTVDHETGLITKYTIGYVTDRSVGNTGGLGGLYGILYALDRPLPFPEAQPWKISWQYQLFQKIGALLG